MINILVVNERINMILITGANGFIGKRLREYVDCITVDYDKCDYNGDLSDPDFIKTLPDVDTVIHLAAFNSTKNFYSTPFSVIDSIVTPTMNLLKRYPTAHFVYASSSEGYASTVNQGWAPVPTPEDVALTIEDITNPRWCYASGKIAMESQWELAMYTSTRCWYPCAKNNTIGPLSNQSYCFGCVPRP